MSTIQLKESKAREVMHLFEVMKKYNAKCSLEINIGKHNDPFVAIAQEPVSTEYFVEEEGEVLVVSLGETDLTFDVDSHSFAKEVTDCQILICIVNEEYAAWFNSDALPQEAIELANGCDDTEDEVIKLNVLSTDFDESLNYMNQLLVEGRVIKNAKVLGGGEQILTVGYI
ncbi:hypothetical protein M5X00_13000, partial [Paenibacillus alvei]